MNSTNSKAVFENQSASIENIGENAKITLKGVEKQFEHFKLEGLSFCIPKGFVTGFIGRNGAGKTTAIKAMLSLIHYQGKIEVEGREATQDFTYLQDVGIVMDDAFLGRDWNMQLVNQAMKIGYQKWDEKLFFAYLKKFEIHEKSKVKELSRGMKIKLMLSIALSHEANLLILDEPTSGLDPMMRDEFTDIIKEFVADERHTVLFSTHITQDLDAIADFIVFIDDGKLVESCTKEEFIDHYLILKGDEKEMAEIPEEIILGCKRSMVMTELLVRRASVEHLKASILAETPSIEKILMLYGRKK